MATFPQIVRFLLCCVYILTQLTTVSSLSTNTSLQSNLDAFRESISQIASLSDQRLKVIAHRIAQIGVQLNQTSSSCYQIIELTLKHGFSQQWSAKLINSNSFYKSDFLISHLISEQFSSLGDFEDCLSVSNVTLPSGLPQKQFTAKYCLASVATPQLPYQPGPVKLPNSTDYLTLLARNWLARRNRIHFLSGICVPSLCSSEQLISLIDKYFAEFLNGMEITVAFCQQKTEAKAYYFSFKIARLITAMTVLLALSGSVLYSTLYYLKLLRVISLTESRGLQRILSIAKCFNISNNLKHLFGFKSHRNDHEYDFRFVHGLRAVLITGSVFVHSHTFLTVYLLSQVAVFDKSNSFLKEYKLNHPLRYNLIYRSFLLVDLFFVLSGFLACYKVLSQTKKVPNFLHYTFEHYIRLAPSMVAILCLTIIAQHSGSGPLFHEQITDPYVEPCRTYWWTHVLLINNFWTLDKMCGPNLWFISANFQLHILLYGTLWLYYRRQKCSIVFTVCLIVVSLLLFLVFNLISLPGLPRADFQLNADSPMPFDSIRLFYTSPQSHILAYFTGALMAMRLIRKKEKTSKHASLLAALFLLVFVLGTMLPIGALELPENHNQSALFVATFLLFFTVIILSESFFFYFLILVRASSFKQLLCSRFLAPIGRLSFAIYLLNPLVNWTNLHKVRQTVPLTLKHLQNMFFIDYFRTFIWALLLYLFVQAPIQNLRYLYIKRLVSRRNNVNADNRRHNAQEKDNDEIKLTIYKAVCDM